MLSLIRLLILSAAGFLSALGSVSAAEPVCKGENLLPKLKAEQPQIHAEIERRAKATLNGDAVLWRIEGGGAPAPSYLLGTLHLPEPRVAALNEKIKTAIQSVSVVALELEGTGDPASLQKELFARPQFMIMPDGKSLWDLIAEPHRKAVESALKVMGMGRERAAGFQPWLPATMLALSPCFNRLTAAGKPGVDQAVERLAKSQGKSIVGLETPAEQFGVLSGLSLETQAIMLADAARLFDRVQNLNETLVQLYLQRRIGWILPFGQLALGIKRSPREEAADREFIEKIMTRRNRNMDERAQKHLAKGGLMIAVGALHLPGEEGLVALLRKRGFTLTAVD